MAYKQANKASGCALLRQSSYEQRLGLHKMIVNGLHNAVAKRTSCCCTSGRGDFLRRECVHRNTTLSVDCGARHTERENLKLNDIVKLQCKSARPGVTALFRAGEISQVTNHQRRCSTRCLSVPLSEAQEPQCATVRGTRASVCHCQRHTSLSVPLSEALRH
jgi:hypothetical protein